MMNRLARRGALLGTLISLGGCADEEPDVRRDTESTTDAEGSDSSTSASGSTAASETGSPTAGEGDSCPLAGMFLACTTDSGATGLAFCDDFDGLLLWGPCLTTTACALNEADCSGMCVLDAGVPTWVEDDGGCGSSG